MVGVLAGKRTYMNRKPVAVTVCRLALGWSALCYAAGALAIPVIQSEQPADTMLLSDFSAVPRPLDQLAPPMFNAAVAESDPVPRGNDLDSDTGAPVTDIGIAGAAKDSIPCLKTIEDGDSADDCDDGAVHKSLSVEIGQRMGANSSNLLGDFDGIRVDFRPSGKLKVNGVAGYPVMSDQDRFNDARQVFGLSANTGKIGRAWDLNSYFIEQQDNGEAIRNAGGALRYLRDRRSLLLWLDYDMAGGSLDAFTASGALRLMSRTTLSATVDVRSSPLRKRHQKYLQQTMAATDGWSWNLPMDRILHYTRELSEEVTTLAVGLAHTFSSRLKMSGSAAVLDVSGDTGSDDNTAPPSEYFYQLQLSGSDLMSRGNTHVLDLSHRITDSMRTSSATLDTRYTINSRWEISPRLHTDYRDKFLDRTVEWVTAPSVRMEYRWRDRYGVKIEAGGEWVTRELPDQASSDSSYFVNLGYKARY